MRPTGLLALGVCWFTATAVGQQPVAESPLPPPDRVPQLVVTHDGPHAPVLSLAFAPDGTLYAGGLGKLVHRYSLRGGQFVAGEPIRVPLGPTNAGAVNAIAVSPDGKWVAVAGRAPLRGELWAGPDDGVEVETRTLSPRLKRDLGVVYLFNPADPQGGKVVRGPEAGVRAIAFAHPAPAAGPVLVTAGVEWDAAGKTFGAVRVYDTAAGKELAVRKDLPATATRPGLAAWTAGGKGETLRVGVAWPAADNAPGKLLVWDVTANKDRWVKDGSGNWPLAVRVGPGGAEEITSGGRTNAGGHLTFLPADLSADEKQVRVGGDGQFLFPLAAAAAGEATAVVLRDYPPSGVTRPATTALWLVRSGGRATARTPLDGADPTALPPLAASPDGKWLAVGGFADHRIEVYDPKGQKVQTLTGAAGGFGRVAFLDGPRLWLGGATDAAPRDGLVFDPAARKVSADGRGRVDAPAGGGPVAWTPEVARNAATREETVTLATAATGRVKFTLLANEKPTAVAYLPAGPAWDQKQGAVLAVAHVNERAAVSLVSLFDAATGRRLFRLSGPTLRVDGLAISGGRPLLAAVGADRTVTLWSLKGLGTPFAAVEGVVFAERAGELAVAAVEPGSPAGGVLKPDAVIEAVGGEKGELKAVKTYREFLLAVREAGVGGTVRVRVKGNSVASAVPVGRGVGSRHPLLHLWVNPTANRDRSHDWIGWTPAGPYDANSLTAEARLGWLTATGNPTEPVRYAGADQYRRAYYKTDFLRFLIEDADFSEAVKRYAAAHPATRPTLTVRVAGAEPADGVFLVRTKPDALDVRLADPDRSLMPDAAVLRWRAVGRDGKPGEWREAPFPAARATPALAGHVWSRGPHRFEATVHETPDAPAAAEATVTFHYAPPAPVVTAVAVNGATVAAGVEPAVEKDVVEVAAEVTAAAGEEVVVTLTTSGPDGQAAVKLPAGQAGRYGPVPVKLRAEAKTTIRVAAVNAGAGGDARFESAPPADVTVRHAPKPKPLPTVRLGVASAVDPPAELGEPFVSDTPRVRLSAVVTADKVEKVEWDDGDGRWVAGEFRPADPKAPVVTRDVTLPEGGKPRVLRVRVSAPGGSRTEEVAVVWAGLPEVDFADLPAVTPSAEWTARGAIRTPPGGAAFDLRLVVAPVDGTGPRREVEVRPEKPEAWQAAVRLAPGDNRLGLVVSNRWKRVRLPEREVRYVRPPLVVVPSVAARGSGLGDVVAAVLSPRELPPTRFTVAGRPTAVKPLHGPVSALGLTVWWLRVESVPLETDGVLAKVVRVAAGNADGDGPAVEVPVTPPPVVPPPPPPRISVTGGPGEAVQTPGASIRTDQPRLTLAVRVTSAAKLVRVELRRTDALPGQRERAPGVDAAAAVAVPDGFEVTANPDLPLREGVNPFEVVATTADARAAFPFSISYTPPPVRVVVDAVEEAGADGKSVALPTPAGTAPYQAAGGTVRVRGRVVWAGAGEAARGGGYDVILVANEVRHLPVRLPAAAGREAAFVAPLFLNAPDTQVRVEVLPRGQAAAVPQQQVADAAVAVRTRQPITQQRLHVVVIAPQVREGDRAGLARAVVAAVDGALPADRPVLHRMTFKHDRFSRASLYAPLVHNVSKPGIVGLLQDVEDEIRRSAGEPGAGGWVNDLVVVYYQGRDLTGKDGQHRLHTTRSIAYTGGGGEQFAVRLDELPPTPGVRLQWLNVIDPDGRPRQGDPLATVPLLMRYPFLNQAAAGGLLPLFQEAVAQKPTVGGVVDRVGDRAEKERAGLAYPPTVTLPNAVRERSLGSGR